MRDVESTVDTERRPGRLVDVLRNRAFLRLWLVQAFSQTGQNMVNFALLILVAGIVQRHQISQANTAISLTVLSFTLPAILFSPIAGVVVERANKRTTLVVTNALRGLAVVGFLLIQESWRPLLALSALYVITFISGTVGQFFGPALGSAIPLLVPNKDIVHANALFNLTFTASQLAGFAALGPVLIKVFGLDPVFVGIIAIFVLCAILSLTIPSTPPPARVDTEPASAFRRMMQEIREGVLFILQSPLLLKAIGYLSLATASYLVVAVLGPDFITGVLKLPRQDIAYIVAPAGIGVVVGVLLVGRVAAVIGAERTIDWAIAAAGVILMLLALSEPLSRSLGLTSGPANRGLVVLAATLAALLGVANAMILAPSQSLLQAGSPEHIRARVYATFFTVSNSVAFIPIIFAGALADLFGVVKVLFAIGAILGLAGIAQLLRSPQGGPHDESP